MNNTSNLSVKITRDEFRSCGACNAQNYDTPRTAKNTSIIFDVKIGNMVNALCPKCLRKLAEDSLLILDAVSAITDASEETTDDDKPPFDL